MSNDKTLATVKHGGCVQLRDWLPPLPCTDYNTYSDGTEPLFNAQQMRDYARTALSAQPSPGGQDGLNYERMFVNACAALAEVSRELGCDPEQGGAEPILAAIVELREALAARQPAGWQPMETAPKNGTEILIEVEWRAGIRGKCLVGHYMAGGHCIEDHPPIDAGWYFWNGIMFDRAAKPVRWMHIPPAQAVAERQPVGEPKDNYESAFQEAEPPPLVVNAAGFRALESFLTVAEEFRRSTEPYIEAINEGGSAGDDEISEVFDKHLSYAKTAVSRSTVYTAPPAQQPAQAVDLGEIIEKIAQQWDGCNYDAVGETIDVGRAIRAAGKRLIDSQDSRNG